LLRFIVHGDEPDGVGEGKIIDHALAAALATTFRLQACAPAANWIVKNG
jgi:hypothetical protein